MIRATILPDKTMCGGLYTEIGYTWGLRCSLDGNSICYEHYCWVEEVRVDPLS